MTSSALFRIAPLAKQSVRKGRDGFHVDPKYLVWTKEFLFAINQYKVFKEAKYSHGVSISITYYFKRPKHFPRLETMLKWSRNKQRKEGVVVTDDGVILKTSQPDVHDNLNKLPLDVLQKAGILSNDSIVHSFSCSKQYADKDAIFIKIEGE